jgi:hypothetical protein
MKTLKEKINLKTRQFAFREWLKAHCGSCKREFTGRIKATGDPTRVESPSGRYLRAMRCNKCWRVEETCASCKQEFSIGNPGTSWPWPKWGAPGRLCYSCK